MSGNEKMVTGVLVGTASCEARALDIVNRFGPCPYVSLFASSGRTVAGVYGIPQSRSWWLEWADERPEVLGLDDAAVLMTERLIAPSPWTQHEVKPCDEPPCGAGCVECPEYRGRCSGCPSICSSGIT
jgi:hypothetical protein